MVNRLSHIYKVTTLTADRKVGDVLSCIMHDVKYNLGFDRAGFYLLDEKKEFLELKGSIGFNPSQKKRAFSKPLNMKEMDCFQTRVARTGKEIIVNDTENDSRATNVDKKINKLYERRSALYFPLKIENELIGVLGISSRKPGLSINQRDHDLIRIFVTQASIAFKNARLYEKLLNEKKFTESVLQSSVKGIMTIGTDGSILFMNSAAEKILGIRLQDTSGNSLGKILPELSIKLLDRQGNFSISEDQIKDLEINYRDGEREYKVLNVNATQLITDKRQNLAILITIEDLTEKKKKDEYLGRMEKMVSLGYLAAGIAHEVRNPLTSISVDLDRLFEKFFAYPEEREILKNVLGEIDRLDRIVSQLLEFARITPVEFKQFELNSIVRNVCNLVQGKCLKTGIKIRRNFQSNLPEMFGAGEKIEQAILNIVLNSIQAMPKGGQILIKTSLLNTENGKKLGCWQKAEKKIEILIKDNGIGISKDNLSKIFYPFFTTKPEGTGLGLSIANSIVEEHKGLIIVNSTEGKGSFFRIQLPIT